MEQVVINPSFQNHLGVISGTFIAKIKILSRYKGALVMDIIIPLILAAMPILLGQAMAGSLSAASANFQLNTGLTEANYIAYIIIGANVFASVSTSLWLFGFFVRREQMLGTLESLSLTPASNLSILTGLSLYVEVRTVLTFIIGYFFGCVVFGINPFQGHMLLALFILAFGLIPIFGLSFVLGALILKIKEAKGLLNALQWGICILMGVFFPITVLPSFLQILALIFPAFYLNYDVQAALTGIEWFFGNIYIDLGVIFGFTIICPLIGYWIFDKTETRAKKADGIGQF